MLSPKVGVAPNGHALTFKQVASVQSSTQGSTLSLRSIKSRPLSVCKKGRLQVSAGVSEM